MITVVDLIVILLFLSWALVQMPWDMVAHSLAAGSRNGYQSKWSSLYEQLINTGSGFLLSLFFWCFVVAPLFDLDTSFVENFGITVMFTFLSIARGFAIRRFFNWLLNHFGA